MVPSRVSFLPRELIRIVCTQCLSTHVFTFAVHYPGMPFPQPPFGMFMPPPPQFAPPPQQQAAAGGAGQTPADAAAAAAGTGAGKRYCITLYFRHNLNFGKFGAAGQHLIYSNA